MKTHLTIRPCAVIALVSMVALLRADAQVPGGRQGGSKERLVTGNFGELTDAQGNRWSVQQSGIINRGSNSLLSSCGQLFINNQQFYSAQNPMMTADRKEYVIEHANAQQLGGLRVTRRIRVMEKEGCLRFLEVFENPTAGAIMTNVEVRHQLGTKYKEYFTEEGNRDVATFGRDESGIYILPESSSASYKPVMFTACSPGAKAKPRLMSQNQYTLHFYYQLQIPAGQSVVVMHTMAQPGEVGELTRKSLAGLFKASSFKSVLKSVPLPLRSRITNFSAAGAFGGLATMSGAAVDGLGVDRGRSDVLALGKDSRMLGTASCAELKLATAYGEAPIPFERVAAFVGSNHGRRQMSRIFLRDGQVYTGRSMASDLRFVMSDGTKVKLSVESLDRLVRKEASEDGKWGEDVGAMIETFAGDRIAISNGAEVMLDAVTPWGPVRFCLDDLLWLSPPDDGAVGHHIVFRDGSRFFAYLAAGALQIDSGLFGRIELESGRVRAIVTAAALAKAKEQEVPVGFPSGGYDGESLQVPHVLLSGGQRIIGGVAATTIGVVTNAELIEIPPENIRLMHSMRDEYEGAPGEVAPFLVELWGGSVITGQIKEAVIPMTVREQRWSIPVGDIVDLVSPTPRISDENRQRIGELIRELGNEEWERRESATDQLAEFGQLAKALLLEALKVTPDAEVRRRIDHLLNEMP